MPRKPKEQPSNGKEPLYPLDPGFDPSKEYQPDSQPDNQPNDPTNLLPDRNPDGTWELPPDLTNPDAEYDPDPDSPVDRRPDQTPIGYFPIGGFKHDAHAIGKHNNLIRHTRTLIETKDPSGKVTTTKITTNRRYRSPLFGG